jgi:hypothetical protein
MATLATDQPPVTTDAPDTVTDPLPLGDHVARLMAAKLIARGDSPQDVREYAATRPKYACMWDAVANAMDALAVPAPRVTSDPSAWDLDPATELHVARLYLTRLTPGHVRDCIASGVVDAEFAPMFAGIADVMDDLLAAESASDPAAA